MSLNIQALNQPKISMASRPQTTSERTDNTNGAASNVSFKNHRRNSNSSGISYLNLACTAIFALAAIIFFNDASFLNTHAANTSLLPSNHAAFLSGMQKFLGWFGLHPGAVTTARISGGAFTLLSLDSLGHIIKAPQRVRCARI